MFLEIFYIFRFVVWEKITNFAEIFQKVNEIFLLYMLCNCLITIKLQNILINQLIFNNLYGIILRQIITIINKINNVCSIRKNF